MPPRPKFLERKKSPALASGLSQAKKQTLAILDSIAYGLEVQHVMYGSSTFRPSPDRESAERIVDARRRRARREKIREMKRKDLLETRKTNRGMELVITEKGRMVWLKLKTKSAAVHPDGKCTYVTYDIPEMARRARDALRYFLKSSGFKRLHYSVWVTEKDIYEPICAWVSLNKLGKWVKTFQV